MDVTHKYLILEIEQAKPGNRLGDISAAIQKHTEDNRYDVIHEFYDHSLDRLFHNAPEVIHTTRAGTEPELRPDMFFTIEPIINLSKSPVKLLDNE